MQTLPPASPSGGAFDGALGVIAALEVATVIVESGVKLPRPIEVIGTADEEGRHGGMPGSQAMAGLLDDGFMATAASDDGVLLADAMTAAGLDPAKYRDAARAPSDLHAFLELHIEQGPVLEAAGEQVGIVSCIAGVMGLGVTMRGEANHSGTTPMRLRKDAFMGLAVFGAAIPGIIERVGSPASRITVGYVQLEPNFAHSVPGVARFNVNIRDTSDDVMEALATEARAALAAAADAHHLELVIEQTTHLACAPCVCRCVGLFSKFSLF